MGSAFWIDQLVFVSRTVIAGVILFFITPYVQRWLKKRAIPKQQKNSKEVRWHYTDVIVCSIDPHTLTQYLTLKGIVVINGAVRMIIGMVWLGVLAIESGPPPLHNDYVRLFWNLMAIYFAVSGARILSNRTADAMTIWDDIKSFDKYVDSVPTEFRNFELERLAREKLEFPPAITVLPPPPTTD